MGTRLSQYNSWEAVQCTSSREYSYKWKLWKFSNHRTTFCVCTHLSAVYHCKTAKWRFNACSGILHLLPWWKSNGSTIELDYKNMLFHYLEAAWCAPLLDWHKITFVRINLSKMTNFSRVVHILNAFYGFDLLSWLKMMTCVVVLACDKLPWLGSHATWIFGYSLVVLNS